MHATKDGLLAAARLVHRCDSRLRDCSSQGHEEDDNDRAALTALS